MEIKHTLAAAYLRLSKEDGDKVESDSISSQRALVQEFVTSHPDITLIEEYVDDGYTGTNFDRPAFKRMMTDIERNRINCVIVKDLSRFGRNYIEVGRYLEKVFPALGVRFIAVNDNHDSGSLGAPGDDILIPFKNLINDSYSRDISTKVRSQLDVKRRRGQFIGSFAAYGYEKDPEDHNHLVVDEEAAAVVRSIFNMKLDGMNHQRIAESLNDLGVLTPFDQKRSKGLHFESGFRTGSDLSWNASMVGEILRNEVYLGTMVQGKMKKVNYKVKKNRRMSSEEWIRVEGTHEAIISPEIFGYVQELLEMDTRTSPGSEKLFLFAGFLRCGDCGQNMIRRPCGSGKYRYTYYGCSTYVHTKECPAHLISEKKLEQVVFRAIKMRIEELLSAKDILDEVGSLPERRRSVEMIERQIAAMEDEAARYRNFKARLYQDYLEGIQDKDEYQMLNAQFTEKLKAATETAKKLREKRAAMVTESYEVIPWIESIRKYQSIEQLDRRVLIALVDHIDVFDKEHIAIHFRFEEELTDVLETVKEMEVRVECDAQSM